ncbi:aminotransferase class I/II-fold pyridoxal phosphate-dependent enzyme [Anthocerotibacter panamensis]|uniref:aminotransferase class I/II-fold pyridoxal phosphate-dependent enzyme n=1 Tax=Anthocerotibacter panamensis TaxID=2857077 RepID=UPI00247851AB|nr:aminotransferase class I/II-fold pyridoxal phosphate-dependent enzyme [Anthocerotibacter panamensis]
MLTVNSLTKVYGLSWARCGWVFAPPAVTRAIGHVLLTTAGSAPPSSAALGLAAFAAHEQLWQRSHQWATTNFQRVKQWLDAQPHLYWQAPPHGLFGFVWHRSGENLRSRIEQGCADRGVLVVPGQFFGAPTGFRLAWSCHETLLETGLQQLEAVMVGEPP